LSNIIGIAVQPLALQLKLTGMEVFEVSDAEAAENALEAVLDTDTQAVVVDERLRKGLSLRMQHALTQRKGAPLVIYCPEFDSEASGTDSYIASVLKQAIGYEIRLD